MSWQSLLARAAENHGYFTTTEAAEHGVSWRALSGRVERGNIDRAERSLYRLPHWPAEPNDEFYALQALAPFGTFSHETALSLLGLSDIIPTAIHFTIPESSRLGLRAGIRLHRSRHRADQDRIFRDGLWVNTARRALLDSARIGSDPDQLLDAAREAKDRAMLTAQDIARLREHRLFRRAGW
jgi:predicted transcriptional regulator of viral defense system